MNPVKIRQSGNKSYWIVDGDLDFSSVPQAWEELRPLIVPGGQLNLSLERVKHVNSAALALLLQGMDLARATGCDLQYLRLPDKLVSLAEMSNVDTLLGVKQVAS